MSTSNNHTFPSTRHFPSTIQQQLADYHAFLSTRHFPSRTYFIQQEIAADEEVVLYDITSWNNIPSRPIHDARNSLSRPEAAAMRENRPIRREIQRSTVQRADEKLEGKEKSRKEWGRKMGAIRCLR